MFGRVLKLSERHTRKKAGVHKENGLHRHSYTGSKFQATGRMLLHKKLRPGKVVVFDKNASELPILCEVVCQKPLSPGVIARRLGVC